MLCGKTPHSSIMLKTQRMSPSLGPSSIGFPPWPRYFDSSWKPWLPLASPCTSAQMTSQRLLRKYTRSPSTAGDEQIPRYSQSETLPVPSLGMLICHRSSPLFSSRQYTAQRSPVYFGSRGVPLFVPT